MGVIIIQFALPLLFYCSGRSSILSKTSFKKFLIHKIQRLIIPLIFGYIFIIIPTNYIGRRYRPCPEHYYAKVCS